MQSDQSRHALLVAGLLLALARCTSDDLAIGQTSADGGILDPPADATVEQPTAQDSSADDSSDGTASDSSSLPDAAGDSFDADEADASTYTPAIWSSALVGNVWNARLALTPQGDLVLAGMFGAGKIDTGVPGQVLTTNSNDWFITKLPGSGGAPYWLRHVSSGSFASVAGVAVASDGSIYVAGHVGDGGSNVDYHSMPGAPAGSDNPQVALLKLDASGGFVWAHSSLEGVGVALAPGGGVFLAEAVTGEASTLATVTRLDAAGSVVAQRSFGVSSAQTHVWDLVADSSGFPVVEFGTSSTVDFGAGPETGSVTVKFDSDLNTVWSESCKVFGTLEPTLLALSDDGHILVAGRGTPSCAGATSGPTNPAFFLLYDQSGQLVFSQLYQESPEFSDVAFDQDTRIYLAGDNKNSAAFASGWFVGGSDFNGANPFAWVVPQGRTEAAHPTILPVSPGRVIVAAREHSAIDLGNGVLLGAGLHGLVIAEIAP